MKVIDLLNKIANGEEVPKIIKYDETIYLFRNYDYKEYSIEKGICDEQTSWIEDKFDFYKINDEVEIIEEDKKIEKIKILNCDNYVKKENYETILTMQEIALDISTLKKCVNKIIDYLEEKE